MSFLVEHLSIGNKRTKFLFIFGQCNMQRFPIYSTEASRPPDVHKTVSEVASFSFDLYTLLQPRHFS